jgi:zinc protease
MNTTLLILPAAAALLVGGGFSLAAAESRPADYAIVVSQKTRSDAGWASVVDTLREKHRAAVVSYATNVLEALPDLKQQFPRYVCFVAPPAEATRPFVAEVHRLTRRFDDDPYTDCFWGILTGYDAANARRIAQFREPLTVRKVASGTELAMDMVEQGVWFCELKQGRMVRKEPGQAAVEQKGPDDTTKALVDTLNEYHADLFVSSGHATERDWMIGFRYKNGFFKHENGQLYGLDTQGRKFPVQSPNPKVYLPIGNCLMGHIDRPDCMALAWMNSAGVHQMLGYTLPTWYGYMGWGVLDYFVEQPGRYTLTEAFFANHHALTHRLATGFPDMLHAAPDAQGQVAARPSLSAEAKAAGLTPNDARGLVFDRDVVAFYGDPAWAARLADRPGAFGQKLTRTADTYLFEITPQRGADSFKPINRNGSQRGGRPFVAFLPHRIREAKVIEGADLKPVITDDFILVPNPLECDVTRKYRVLFRAEEVR